MKGEIYQACYIVASAKNALKINSSYQPTEQKYISSTTFTFINRKVIFTKPVNAYTELDWFEKCKEYGLTDVKLLIPYKSSDLHLRGFINTVPLSIVCFFKHNKVTYFTPHWYFDNIKREWHVKYTENSWPNHPQGKPEFNDNIAEFSDALLKIEDLARKIDCDFFADIFKSSYDILNESSINNNDETIQLPANRMKYFLASENCDVFGAMGSWNDSPPYMADEKGLSDDYKTLSSDLYMQMTLATLYAINEW